ncbi:MAG: adenine nucleotide alpha hydrolase [Candidatus Omnitrophica bacterium]|nr:adenine nucleotide alpha hydrolase [Candidatus Omnitrophota bacterium]
MRPKALFCWSGGKDSALALHDLRRAGTHEVVGLLTTVTGEYDRISMHGVRRSLLAAQARAIGLPLTEVVITAGATNAEYEAKMGAALAAAKAQGVTHCAFGDIFLEDLKRWREARLAEAGFTGLFPIWQQDTRGLIRRFLRLGFRTVVACVDPKTLPASFAGRVIDEPFLRDLPPTVDPCGENGEFHTFTYAGPIFRSPIAWTRGETVTRDGFVFCDLLPS